MALENSLPLRTMQEIILEDLGLVGYKEAWDYQEGLLQQNVRIKAEARARHDAGDVAAMPGTVHHLLFLEHLPVLTLGKSGHEENVLISQAEMEQAGIQYFKTNRGGDITFHGPGQLVGYPILDLEKFYTDIGRYLRNLEEVIIRTMAMYGLQGHRSPGETGVWLDPGVKGQERKICAMGVRCSRWITMHGFAFNINTNLDYFHHIIPCGIRNKQVTSMQRELGREVPVEEVKAIVRSKFEEVFGAKILVRGVPVPARG